MSHLAPDFQKHAVADTVRAALQQGRLEDATRLMGRRWEIESVVEHGDARGRTMGFPTANMHLADGYPLAFGIYAVRIAVLSEGRVASRHHGVANFGIRPMYRITHPLLEAHLFDFDGDLYGMTLRVEFFAFLRPEASFPSLDALIAQIGKDAKKARDLLSSDFTL
jgi:riboflavin kinase/FMN adenylyltransferase